MTHHYAVFGDPIKHSKSPQIHTLFAQQTNQDLDYVRKQVSPSNFLTEVYSFFDGGGKGLNCTVPLKELAWRYFVGEDGVSWKYQCELTPLAKAAKAVNTLYMKDGKFYGHNTDGVGLVHDLLKNHHIDLADKRILILGAGGASRGIINPLLWQKPSSLVVANRTLSKAEALLVDFPSILIRSYKDLDNQKFDLIINATSTSLTGELPPLPDNILASNGCCYDLAYGDEDTVFVTWGKKHNARKSLDGLGMLVEQAAEAFLIWTKMHVNSGVVIEHLDKERKSRGILEDKF